MRTRAQTSLCNEVRGGGGRTGLRSSKFRVKASSNGAAREKPQPQHQLATKRKAAPAAQLTPPVIKKHKRGLNKHDPVPGQESGGNRVTEVKPPGQPVDEVKTVSCGGNDVEKVSARCTVNTDEAADVYVPVNPSVQPSETSCSTRDEPDGAGVHAPTATRTPLFFPVVAAAATIAAAAEVTVPAKRSPLPLPPSAVRSALPAVPAVRSALPLPPVETESLIEDDNEMVTDEVDTHGFSSAVAGFEEDGSLPFDEDGVGVGNGWPEDGCPMEMRKRTGPGSRATYRCSKCLAPKKGHRCPLEESEDNKDDAKGDLVPNLSHRTDGDAAADFADDKSVDELLSEISKQEDTFKPEPAEAGTAESQSRARPSTEFLVKEFSVSAKWLLETGVLEGHRVRYMPRAGEVSGNGVVQNGVILCSCRQCKGLQGFNASSFEKHVGSTARHPSDFIFLDNGRCLREILEDGSRFKDKPVMMEALRAAVSLDWDGSCFKCGKSGDLVVICSGKDCLNSYHQGCAGIPPSRMKGWLCSDCQPKNEASSRGSSRFRLRSAT